MSSKMKNSDGSDYKGAKAVKRMWRNNSGGMSLKGWARAQRPDGAAATWLANKRLMRRISR